MSVLSSSSILPNSMNPEEVNLKARLKDAAKVVQDLAPLYRSIVEFHKSLEYSRKIADQVAQKFVEIGLSKIGTEWGQSYVTIGELQHSLNKNIDIWVASIRELCTTHLCKAIERDKEDIHVFAKNARSSISMSSDVAKEAGDRSRNSLSQASAVLKFLDVKGGPGEKKRLDILSEIDMFEREKFLRLGESWVSVMGHQPVTPNTALLDKFLRMNRIPGAAASSSSSHTNMDVSPRSNVVPTGDTPPASSILSPRSLERAFSLSHIVPSIPPPISPKSNPPMRTLVHTLSQASFLPSASPPHSPIMQHTAPLPSSSSMSRSTNSINSTPLSLKNIFGKIGKSFSAPSVSTSPRSASPRSASVDTSTPPSPPSLPPTAVPPADSVVPTASPSSTSSKSKMGTMKRPRRHTIVTPPEIMGAKDGTTGVGGPFDPMIPPSETHVMYPPKRNFAYKQDVNNLPTQFNNCDT